MQPKKLRRMVSFGVVAGVCLAAGLSGPVHAAAAPVTYYFHGGNADDAERAAGTPTATFDTTAPLGVGAPSAQTAAPRLLAGSPCGDAKSSYWTGPFTGAISGTLHIDWWWQTTNAEAIAVGTQQDITVCADGSQIGSKLNAPIGIGPTPTESTVDIAVSGTAAHTLVIEATPSFTDTGEQNTVLYNTTTVPSFFTISTGAPPPPTPTPTPAPTPTPGGGMTGPQLFHNYQSPYPYPHEPPPPSAVALLFGEPSIGVDWGTSAAGSNLTMYQGDLNTWQVKFDYTVKPPTAVWNDRSDVATDNTSLDPRLITDHAGNAADRTFVEQLHLVTSAQAYSDTDGGTATPPTNSPDWIAGPSGVNGGADHESIAAGRYSTYVTPPAGAGTVYAHALYYCSQNTQNAAFCIRSDNGGISYGAPSQILSSSQCTTLHGKPRIGPDGVVYIPDKDCGGQAAVIISKDNGATWNIVQIPGSSTGSDANGLDPDVAVGGSTGMGTVYFTYRDGDHKAKVVVSTDDGATWSTPTDLGSFFNIQNATFTQVIAGDANRAAATFIGTSAAGDDSQQFFTDANGMQAIWYLYTAFTYDGGQTWQVVNSTPNDPVQRGGVCGGGTGCPSAGDGSFARNMLDFNDITVDNQGRVEVAYTDGCTAACETSSTAATCSAGNQNCMGRFSSVFSMVDQVCGMGLFKTFDPGFNNDPNCSSTPIAEAPFVGGLAVFGMTAVGVLVMYRRRRGGRYLEPA